MYNNDFAVCQKHCKSTILQLKKKTKQSLLNRFFYTYIRSSMIHNSQKVETTQMSINGWMNKQNVIQI